MNEIKINEMVLKYNIAEKFNKIKEHMEVCCEEDLNNEYVVMQLIEMGMSNYRFL